VTTDYLDFVSHRRQDSNDRWAIVVVVLLIGVLAILSLFAWAYLSDVARDTVNRIPSFTSAP